jgi:hypothetical protein
MARRLSVEIDGNSTSGRKAIDSLAAEADKAAKDLDKMAAKADAASVKARKLAEAEERAGDKTRELASRMQALQKEIAESGDESGKLTRKLERLQIAVKTSAHATDDYRRAASRASAEAREQARAYDKVGDNARQAARAVAALRAASMLPGGGKRKGGVSFLGSLLGIGADGALSAGGGVTAALKGILGTPGVGPAAIGAGVAAGGLGAGIAGGAAAGGALLAGGAVGGAGLGLAGAWMGDPVKYTGLWNEAIDGIQHRWLDSSSAFGDELEAGLQVVDRTLRDLPVEKILDLSQSFVMPLAVGAGSGITAAADGFADLLEKGQVVVDRLGPEIADFGHDVGDSFRMVAEGSEGGAEALGDFVNAAGYVVKATGLMILGFETAYHNIREFEKANFEFIDSVPVVGSFVDGLKDSLFGIESTSIGAGRALGGAGEASHEAAFNFGEMATEAAKAAAEAATLTDSMTAVRSASLAAADADIALAQGWADLKEELADGKRTLDLSTQAGRDHQKALLSQVEAAEASRQKQIQLTGDIGAADAAYATNIEMIKKAAYAAGYNKQQVDALIQTWARVQPVVQTQVKTPGLFGALSDAARLAATLGDIDGTYNANVYVNYHQRGQALNPALAHGGIRRAATGMIIPPSDPGTTLVGEPQTGGELLLPLQGISRNRAMSLMQPAASGYGLKVTPADGAQQARQAISRMGPGSGVSGGGSVRVDFSGARSDDVMTQWFIRGVDSGQIQIFAGGDQVTARP